MFNIQGVINKKINFTTRKTYYKVLDTKTKSKTSFCLRRLVAVQ